ncbi:hypothetical protein CQ018_02465 [Arthrobacter sp. MYb227]|nr:hypothetical protein CQ018_02465 [Arthrobacter sp. MYb227]
MVFAGTAALALSACGSQVPEAAPYLQAEHENLRWSDGSKVKLNRVDLQDANKAIAGKDFTEVSNTQQWALGDSSFGAMGLDANGNLFGSMVRNQGIDPATNALTAGSMVGTVKNGKFDAFPLQVEPPNNESFRQVIAGDSDGKNFVWVETADTSIVASSWVLYSKPAKSHEPIRLASSADDSKSQVPPLGASDIQPVIRKDRVYWHETVQTEADSPITSRMRSVDLAGTESPRDEANDVAYPASLDVSMAVFAMTPDTEQTQDEFAESLFPQPSGISLVDELGNTTELLKVAADSPEDSHFGMMRGSGNTVVFSYNGETLIVDTLSRQVTSFEEPTDSNITGLAQCGDLSTWAYMDVSGELLGKQYVYNVKDQSLRAVEEPKLFGTSVCHDNYLAWSVHDVENDGAFATEIVTEWKR